MVPESGSSRDISSRRKNFKTRKSKPSLPFSSWLQNTFEKWASLVTQTVKNLSAMWETHAQSLGQEDALEKGMATHSSILTWRIPWTEEPGRLQSMGPHRV